MALDCFLVVFGKILFFFLYFFLENTDNFINSLKSLLNFLMMRSTLIWGSSENKNWHLFENFHFLSVFDVTEFKAFELYEFQVKFCLFQGPFSSIFINLTKFFYWRCIFLFFCFLPSIVSIDKKFRVFLNFSLYHNAQILIINYYNIEQRILILRISKIRLKVICFFMDLWVRKFIVFAVVD